MHLSQLHKLPVYNQEASMEDYRELIAKHVKQEERQCQEGKTPQGQNAVSRARRADGPHAGQKSVNVTQIHCGSGKCVSLDYLCDQNFRTRGVQESRCLGE